MAAFLPRAVILALEAGLSANKPVATAAPFLALVASTPGRGLVDQRPLATAACLPRSVTPTPGCDFSAPTSGDGRSPSALGDSGSGRWSFGTEVSDDDRYGVSTLSSYSGEGVRRLAVAVNSTADAKHARCRSAIDYRFSIIKAGRGERVMFVGRPI